MPAVRMPTARYGGRRPKSAKRTYDPCYWSNFALGRLALSRQPWAEQMSTTRIIAATCAFGLLVTGAIAQPAKTLKQQLVGTWDQVVSEVTMPDGNKLLPFGEKPNGILIFTED